MKAKMHMKLGKSRLHIAVAMAMVTGFTTSNTFAQQEDNEAMEEVVAVGTRLKGSAAAVMQERQNQAFVADILGAEQIARTGDSDAASALRRVTGLTLVDGKFIYVRGLGERYSSTELNSMMVPSPDPTRSVIPLDLFPASIIESLSVQKAFSPDMPAHFGGGNVNVRTRSIPNDSVFNVQIQAGLNTTNSDDSPWYEGGGDDWQGRDDGTRQISPTLNNIFNTDPSSLVSISNEVGQQIVSELNRNISSEQESVDPNTAGNITFGDFYEFDNEMKLGFLAAAGYDSSWLATDERNVYNLRREGDGGTGINEFEDGQSTERTVRWSGMLNFGFEYNKNHKLEWNNMFLHDTRDRYRDRLRESTNTIQELDEQLRVIDILYEEREMKVGQIRGTHMFPEFNTSSFDWYYSESTADRDAPGGFEALFAETLDDEGVIADSRLSRAAPPEYSWQRLNDRSKTFGFNFTYPVYGDGYDIEFKAGADFFDKARTANNVTVDLQIRNTPAEFLIGDNYTEIFSDENLSNPDFRIGLEDRTFSGDKFVAATKLDAYYFMADAALGDWRITAGVRYEDFKQISLPNLPHTGIFDATTEEISELALNEDDLFPSLALTYQIDSEMQLRLNLSETNIRPDLRDLSTTFYIDPLTDLLVRGSTQLQSSNLTNADLRWEWYMSGGNNISVALFYKDIENPIELIEIPSATEGPQQLLTANAEEGEVYGTEIEFLHDLAFIGGIGNNLYVSGNVTLSDSNVSLGLDDRSGLFYSQLSQALPGNPSPDQITSAPTNNERRLIGHSEWVANLQIGYDSPDGEHTASLVYNVFGERIIITGADGFQDGFEQPFHSLDLIYNYFPTFNTQIRVRARNLLDEEKEIVQEGVTILREDVGTVFDIRFRYEF